MTTKSGFTIIFVENKKAPVEILGQKKMGVNYLYKKYFLTYADLLLITFNC